MPQLILIRHGQASFGSDDYDRLSELGQRQARAVGRALQRSRISPSHAYSGLMVRQRHTADLALEEAGVALSVNAQLAFNEYDSDGVFGNYLPAVLESIPEIRARVTASDYSALKDPGVFRKVFYPVMHKWINGEQALHGSIESWDEFRTRVIDGLHAVAEQLAPGQTGVIFTSGGVISVMLAYALGIDWQHSVDFNWRTANGSISRLSTSRSGFSLDGYNHHAHLEDEEAGLKVTFL